jgi:hypothetical protein
MIRFHADFQGQEEDFEEMRELVEMINPSLTLKTYEHLEDCLGEARTGDIVILDWGGLSSLGMSEFINHYERITEKAIEDNPNITFVFWETMSGYYDPHFYSYPNVKAVDRSETLKGFTKIFNAA